MSETPLLVDRVGRIAVVTLNRPKVHNALNAAILREIGSVFSDLEADAQVNAAVLTGAGTKSFCAGADLDELEGLDATTATDVLRAGQAVMNRIAGSRLPIISAVNGLALGGGFELILSTTFPILSERASLGLPESGLGLIPGYGGTQRLPALIGRASAAHLMLTGERISADRAYQLGLTPVAPVAPDELLASATRIAETIASRGPGATAAILEALTTSFPRPEHLSLESSLAGAVTGSADAAEGIAAFKERRTPQFGSRGDSST